MAYSTIPKGSLYMNTKLYTGNESTRSETGVGFQPDFTWIKVRSRADPHILTDAVRGTSSQLSSDTSGAQQTFSNMITSFNSDGFSLGANVDVNRNSETFVAWNWKAGGGQGSSNTDGSINTTYTSVNTTAGFSISKYTGNATNGATVGHGLGAVPEMLIGKDLSDTSGWGVWHKDLTNAGYRLDLSTTAAQSDDTALFGGSSRTAPTSSVFTLGSGGGLNGSNANIMYAFTSITGYSKISSYTGNGNTNGTFVYTGFKPAFVMFKRIDSTSNWTIVDTKRDTYNPTNKRLFPDLTNADNTSLDPFADLVSNGFKLKTSSAAYNASGGTYIYMAFAENPLVATSGTSAVPVTAR